MHYVNEMSAHMCVCDTGRKRTRRRQGCMPKATWAPDKVGYNVTVITHILASHNDSLSVCLCLYKCFSVPILSLFSLSSDSLFILFLFSLLLAAHHLQESPNYILSHTIQLHHTCNFPLHFIAINLVTQCSAFDLSPYLSHTLQFYHFCDCSPGYRSKANLFI